MNTQIALTRTPGTCGDKDDDDGCRGAGNKRSIACILCGSYSTYYIYIFHSPHTYTYKRFSTHQSGKDGNLLLRNCSTGYVYEDVRHLMNFRFNVVYKLLQQYRI